MATTLPTAGPFARAAEGAGPPDVVGSRRVSAIVVAYGAEPWLERSVLALLASEGVDADVIVVDNGCTDGGVSAVSAWDRVAVVRPGRNVGFTGGCNLGAAAAGGDVLAFVNPDAIVSPSCLAALAAAVEPAGVGLATASVRLATAPDRLNSAGNEIHMLGFSWSGHFDEPAERWAAPRDVTAASGAAMAARRDVWTGLGGMVEELFAYYEDAELSLRCWQQGWRVVYVPEAVVVHRYEFSRHPRKNELAERNRLWLVLTLYEPSTIVWLLPGLLAAEAATLALACAGGWPGAKVRGWIWLSRHRRALLAARRKAQGARVLSDGDLARLFVVRLDPGNYPLARWLRPLDGLLGSYLSFVRRRL